MLYEKIIEIIVYLLAEIKENKHIGEADMENLSKLGYTQNEINTAFSWIYTKMYSGEKIFIGDKSSSHSHRVLHNAERFIITPESHGYLIQLRELGLISDMDMEVIIDKIMLSGYTNVELQDMKIIIAGYLLDTEDMNNNNRRIMLNANDTVN